MSTRKNLNILLQNRYITLLTTIAKCSFKALLLFYFFYKYDNAIFNKYLFLQGIVLNKMESSTVPPSTSQDNLKKSESSITSEKKSEEIIANFQRLRSEQRGLASKLNTLEIDLNEHKVVIDQLKTVDPDRKCFRMIGGILTERTVKEVLPILISNTEQLGKVIEAYNKNLIEKGKLINQYKELHNIKVRGQDDVMPEEDKTETPRNVLVANN